VPKDVDAVEFLIKEYSVDPYVVDDEGKLLVFVVLTIAPRSFIIKI